MVIDLLMSVLSPFQCSILKLLNDLSDCVPFFIFPFKSITTFLRAHYTTIIYLCDSLPALACPYA